MSVDTYNVVTVNACTFIDANGAPVNVPPGSIVNTVLWDGSTDWTPSPVQINNADGTPAGDPQLTEAVLASVNPAGPSTYVFDWATGTFSQPDIVAADVSSPGLISRILSAINPFK